MLMIRRLTVVKISILPKAIYRFNTILVKIPIALCEEMERPILKLIWNCKGSRRAKTILKKKSQVGGLTLPNFKTYHKATVIKIVWYWHKDTQTNQ